jgi:hypothetical protein
MEKGFTEFFAAALAGLVVITVADFIFLSSTTGGWFAPSIGAGSPGSLPFFGGSSNPAANAPPTVASGGLPPTVTC